ncbi:MAG TPA: hypothetical protein HA298_05335 [Methanobacteriales archaeon]|nr:hypothetical protein [Methanobacteriaceae archaeon]MBC7096610.1 hypothetical protein [Methanobacteriales archaeon]HIH62090.1 hypothetical protein [Methanobacteriales archaeon]
MKKNKHRNLRRETAILAWNIQPRKLFQKKMQPDPRHLHKQIFVETITGSTNL